MNWKLHIFLTWFFEFVVVFAMYKFEPLSSLIPLILMTPLSVAITYIIWTDFRKTGVVKKDE